MKKTLPAMAAMEVDWVSVAFLVIIYGLPLYILVRVIMMIRSHLRRRDEESRLMRLELGKIGHELEAVRKAQTTQPDQKLPE